MVGKITRKKLPNGKVISFKNYDGREDFSVALQIPITDEKAIQELKKRATFCAKNEWLDRQESSKNFHITLQVFYLSLDEIKKASEIFESLMKDYTDKMEIKIIEENAVFGREKEVRYPVAMVEKSKALISLQEKFENDLIKNNIKYQINFEFNPHVSLFAIGDRSIPSNIFEGILNSPVTFAGSLELSHKNDMNQYFSLTPIDLDSLAVLSPIISLSKEDFLNQLENKLRQTIFTRANILDFFEEIKKRDGTYSHIIHQQRNPKWDRIRLFFKTQRNPSDEEHYFWHTATYQKAIKLLKKAYVERTNDLSHLGRQEEANAFIDYVRGNSPIHSKNTSTRNSLKLKLQ
ncbi:MAG: hypothetical protein A3F11_00265 [Gammaproteobacteria bacterium RIFCSPHIGHO2_12_FULL_37_14]|nr:MAG: hypothetical protein A3F11_00265 [Gammaproteobacteria bacterium RIFCSPHIGHO2_12_FULL_37_14]